MTLLRPPAQTTFLYKFLWWMLPPNIALYLWATADYLAHPFSTTIYSTTFFSSPAARALFALVLAPSFLVIGILLMRRVSGNVIGVLLLLIGLYTGTSAVGVEAPPLLAALSVIFNYPFYLWMGLLFLLFPDGRAYPRRLEPLISAVVIFVLVYSIVTMLGQPDLSAIYGAPVATANVMFNPAFASLYALLTPFYSLAYLPLVPLIILTPIRRYRAGAPGSRERQQIKWLIVCAFLLAAYFSWYAVYLLSGDLEVYGSSPLIEFVYLLVFNVFPPFALGLAILRHKLYDIDIIIRRTLVYSLLTAALAIIYFGSVIIVQQISRLIAGQTSDLAIVVSTLAIAALFNPLRHRIQNTIDRRFFRRKYDAQKTLEAFSIATRDEVDLDALQVALVGVVQSTMQPTKVALWVSRNSTTASSQGTNP